MIDNLTSLTILDSYSRLILISDSKSQMNWLFKIGLTEIYWTAG